MGALRTGLVVLIMMTAFSVNAANQMEADGLIIRYEMGLIYIDIGERNGVMKGDLYDVMVSEVLAHPLTGDTLAVTPTNVGAIQVHQVLAKMSVAKLVHLVPGEDPVLKPITKVRNPERLAEIQHYMKRDMFRLTGEDVSLQTALIPGIYQMKIGEKRKGWVLLGVQVASLIGGIAYRSNGNDWFDQYQNLVAGLPQSEYDSYYSKASDLRKMSNSLFWVAGATYIYSWVDVLWMGGTTSVPSQTSLGFGFAQSNGSNPLLSITHRF